MDFTQQKLTHLVLTHGDIQASPLEVAQLNQQPMILFESNLDKPGGIAAGYQVVLAGYAKYIEAREQDFREYRHLDTALRQLRAIPRPPNAHILKGSVTTHSVRSDYYRLDYQIANGQVIIFNIQPVTKLQRLRDRQEQIALYKVKKDSSGIWRLGEKVPKVSTPHAAVNGQSSNLTKATWLMGKHLEVAFGKQQREYTLFHNPSSGGPNDTWESLRDRMGFTSDVSKHFAKTLTEAQSTGNETAWVAHSQGGIIFSEGVRYLLNGNSSTALNRMRLNGARHPEKGSLLDKQSVALHGNGNNNWRSQRLFNRAGVKVLAIRAHDYDFVHQFLGLNTFNVRKVLGSLVYSNHVLNGSIAQSPHTTVQTLDDWEHNMQHGPGNGRNALQKGFHRAGTQTKKTVKAIKNYLP